MRAKWLISIGLFLAAAPGVQAQGLVFPRPVPPVHLIRPVQPIHLKSQKVNLYLNQGALRVEVEQTFYNPNAFQVEGTYLFPLPENSAVSNFRLTIGQEPVEGKLLSVEEARRIYESYVRQNVDPAILEYVGRNAFRARIFPILPGQERRISLVYSQVAEFHNGVYRAVYPLKSEQAVGQPPADLVVDCSVRSSQPIKAVYSPSHEVQVRRESDHLARATFEGRAVRADRDFVLYCSTSEKEFGLNALAHRRAGEDGYVLLMLAPKRQVEAKDMQPKDVVFVFDTSGSMQGAKMEQARKALQTVLGALHREDRFNVIRFSSDVGEFRSGVVPATPENRAAAAKFVEELRAIGGTAIDDALQAGLASLPAPEQRRGRGAYLVFLTDGLPTIGMTDPERILGNAAKAAPADVRLFTFGVGSDVNTLLLDRLARDHHGDADYVDDSENLEVKVGDFYAKIATPVLSNVRFEVEGGTLQDIYPSRIPDLFAGTQTLVFGRYQGNGKARVVLSGDLNGRRQRHTYEVDLPAREPGQEFVPKLWAGRKIGFLLEEIRLHGEKAELKDEVIRLSKEFGIVTPYTAYLVEEPGLRPMPVPFGGVRRPGLEPAGAGGLGRGSGGLGGANPRAPVAAETRPETGALARSDALKQNVGQDAVDVSRSLRSLRERQVTGNDPDVLRTVQGRGFRRDGLAWRDTTAPAKPTTVAVKYGSDAYFRLLSRTEWARYLALGRAVTFRTGKTTVVAVGETGKEKLTDAEFASLER